jgi:hypothetical protein
MSVEVTTCASEKTRTSNRSDRLTRASAILKYRFGKHLSMSLPLIALSIDARIRFVQCLAAQ